MIYYVTLILSSSIALIGILVKTKDDAKQSKFNKLTKGGWVLLTLVGMLLLFNLFSQFQKDKIQTLQDLNTLQKRMSDSILQAAQRQQLELLIQKQLQKAQTDSFYFLKQQIVTDSLLYKQEVSLNDQRATVLEQRTNNFYLRKELAKQVNVNNSLTYSVDTLRLNAIIEIQLTDSTKAKLKEQKGEIVDVANLILNDKCYNFFYPAYKFNPLLYNFIKDFEIGLTPENSQIYYGFTFDNYVDTLQNHTNYEESTEVQESLPPFASLMYSFGSGELVLHLNNIKCWIITKPFLSSLKSFCNNEVYFYIYFNGESGKNLIKNVNIRYSTIYENHLKHIDFMNFKSLSNVGSRAFTKYNNIALTSKGFCSFN